MLAHPWLREKENTNEKFRHSYAISFYYDSAVFINYQCKRILGRYYKNMRKKKVKMFHFKKAMGASLLIVWDALTDDGPVMKLVGGA